MLSIVLATLAVACGGREESAPPPPPPDKPIRGAAGDTDLRVMVAEIATAKACDQIRGSFRGLQAEGRKDVTTGVLWLRDCKITNAGTQVTFELGGQGWQWTAKRAEQVGAEFELRQYVRFAVRATIRGTLDIGYDRGRHIASVWFTPTAPPDVKFEPIGDIDVDEKGLWSSIVGGIATLATESPDEKGKEKADARGTQTFAHQLVRGLTVAVDLCTGYQRVSLGRAPKGELGPPDPGESTQRSVEIAPNGLLVFGPYEAPHGMHITLQSNGPLRVGLACADDVYPAVDAFVAERPQPRIATLAQRDVNGSGQLAIDDQRCKVALVVRSLAPQQVRFEWKRPASEIAHSGGGPLIHCSRKQTVSSERHESAGDAAARRR